MGTIAEKIKVEKAAFAWKTELDAQALLDIEATLQEQAGIFVAEDQDEYYKAGGKYDPVREAAAELRRRENKRDSEQGRLDKEKVLQVEFDALM